MSRFSYGEVEAAIRFLHTVPGGRIGTFKARIRHLQRIGLLPSSPGRGIKIEYEVADAWKWAVCFALVQCGLPPEAVKSVLGAAGRKLTISSAGAAGHPTEDQIFWLRPEFLSWHLDNLPDWYDRVRLGVVPFSKAMDVAFKGVGGVLEEEAGQVIMINLTKLKRDLFTALKIDWE
jgi:hypothetical protein